MSEENTPYNYRRRHSSTVHIASTMMGGDCPIRLQSMTNTSTMDTTASTEQCMRLSEAGADYVRLTAQGVREAKNIGEIAKLLKQKGYPIPLIADIHFSPKAAQAALHTADKVRINPGNFVDSPHKGLYSEAEFEEATQRVEEIFGTFVDEAKLLGKAIRIGVNHGSLSERMMQRYGDNPLGMVESCMEYLRVCHHRDYHDVVISMKSSNVLVMTQAVRLLISRMEEEGMAYPLHLGVTEAGNETDGRIRSALGIGTLLADGYGDTIRVSLSEDPVAELPVARILIGLTEQWSRAPQIEREELGTYEREYTQRKDCLPVGELLGPNYPPIVLADLRQACSRDLTGLATPPDALLQSEEDYQTAIPGGKIIQLDCSELNETRIEEIRCSLSSILLLSSSHLNPIGDWRKAFQKMRKAKLHTPVLLHRNYADNDLETLMVKASTEMGALLLEGRANGLAISAPKISNQGEIVRIAYSILQAARLRTTTTEYISCPGCGRTLYDLGSTIRQIKKATAGLVGLKIGIMGCIVNGPGEMADADYGYVGAGPGRIDLYRHGKCVEKGIPADQAVTRLVALIKSHGDWSRPNG